MFSIIKPVYAQTKDWGAISGTNCLDSNDIATLQGLECIFANLLSIIIPLAGFAAFIVIIVGGFQYLSSAGDPKQAQKARSIITGGIIGVIAIILVYFGFNLLSTLTGIDPFQFEIPGP